MKVKFVDEVNPLEPNGGRYKLRPIFKNVCDSDRFT